MATGEQFLVTQCSHSQSPLTDAELGPFSGLLVERDQTEEPVDVHALAESAVTRGTSDHQTCR